MHSRILASISLTGLLVASPALAAGGDCCADQTKAMHASHACCDMPCCTDAKAQVDPVDIDIVSAVAQTTFEPVLATAPARQATVVWFMQPVRVGNSLLQGRYVIEHDNDRMARGEPCTHIYAYNDQKNPVVAFHCTHLERPAGKDNTVVLHSTADGYKKLVEFQFAGETGAHGYPTVR